MRTFHQLLIVTILVPTLTLAADIQPGQWRSTETVLEMTSSMLGPEVVARRKAKPAVFESCIRNGDLKARLVGTDKMGLCKGEIIVAGGKITGSRSCTTGLGNGTRRLEGTYTPTRYEYVQETDQPTPQGPNHTKSRNVVERIGECKTGS